MDQKKRTYLLTVFIAAASAAHVRLMEKLTALSQGDMQTVHSNAGSVAVLFNSPEAFEAIGRALESVTLSADRFLLAELGPRTWAFGLNRARNWLGTRRASPRQAQGRAIPIG